MTVVSAASFIAAAMLGIAATLTTARLLVGPSTLDRLVALDTLIAVTMCGIAIWAATKLDISVAFGLAVLALIGFIGSVSVARFRVPDADVRRGRRGHQ